MSNISMAFNRFGLGARSGDSAPENPRRWVVGQFDLYEPRPAPIAAAPPRAQVARQLADYIEEGGFCSRTSLAPGRRRV